MSKTTITPPKIDGFTEPIETFLGGTWVTIDTFIFGVGLAVAGIIGLFGAATIALFGLSDNPPVVGCVVLGGALIAIAIGATYFGVNYSASLRTTWIFKEGFIRKGIFSTDSILWSDVDQLIDYPGECGVRLRLKDSRLLTFYSNEISKKLYAAIRDGVCATLLPRFVADVRSGKKLKSGLLTANQTGVYFEVPDGKKLQFAWHEVLDWFVGGDGLAYVVSVNGDVCLGIRSADVPNLTVIIMAGKSLLANAT